MNAEQTALLLGYIALGDHRQVDTVTVRYWHQDLVGNLDFREAKEAVRRHRLDSTEYLQAAHIHAGVKRIRAERSKDQQRALTGPAAHQRTPEQQAFVEQNVARLRAVMAEVSARRAIPRDEP